MSNFKKRGFGSMDKDRQKQIASMGGISAHKKGNAHEFTSEEAKRAGALGAKKRIENLKLKRRV